MPVEDNGSEESGTAADASERPRRPGRPRDARRDEAILNATLALLQERGYQGLTIDGVAASAGVGRPTIYRRWSSKPSLVVAALVQSTRLALPELEGSSFATTSSRFSVTRSS